MKTERETTVQPTPHDPRDTVYVDPEEAQRLLQRLARRLRSDSGPILSPVRS